MRHAGGILLEVLVSMALFVGAALAILRATSQASDSIDRAAVLQRAEGLRHRPRAKQRACTRRRRSFSRCFGAVDVSAGPRGVRGAALVSNCRV